MQAIILAAGMGKRLKALTMDNTKCMVRVNGVSLIERMLGQLDALNLERIVIVIGYKGKELTDYIATLPVRTPLVYVDNPVYSTTNNIYSLYLAREYMLESDTLLLESDLIFDSRALKQLVDSDSPNLALVAKYESWMDGTVIKLNEDCGIQRFIEKKEFCYGDIASYYKTVNLYRFSKEFSASRYVPFLIAYISALGKNEYYEQVLRVLALLDQPGIKAEVLKPDVPWYEIDDVQDLDIAESMFVDVEQKLQRMNSRYGGYWRYPHLLDFCYLVNPYYPTPQMLAEMQASFETLLRAYPSGQSIHSLLCAKYFGVSKEQIVVGNGAAELIKIVMERQTGRLGIVRPTFEEYPNRYRERIIAYYPENADYAYTTNDLIAYFDLYPVDILCIINPDNPSGNYMEKQSALRLASWAQDKGIRLIVDESFADFAVAAEPQTLLDEAILNTYNTMIVVKSLSKSFGIAGLRLGVLASGDRALIAEMKNDVAIWNINSFAEFYLQICEKYVAEYRKAVILLQQSREKLVAELKAIPYLRVVPSQANYLLCEVLGGLTSHQLCTALLDLHDILIKDVSKKDGINGEYIRIAVKDSRENAALLDALRLIPNSLH